jgi:hypothetical protein
MKFVPVATPQTESEMAVMLSMLKAFEVPHFVHNLGFGGLYPGVQIRLYNVRRIMVAVDHAEHAIELLSVFEQHKTESETDNKLQLSDKLRVILETIIFGWSFPTRWTSFRKDDQ